MATGNKRPATVAVAVVVVGSISIFLFPSARETIVGIPVVVVALAKGSRVADIPIILAERQVERGRIRLLGKTDHQALLDACRELSRRALRGELPEVTYMGREISRFPKPIRALRPNHVAVDRDGRVKIGMFTGWYSFGVWAFPEGYQRSVSPGQGGYGDRKLLEGLWYYDEGYRYQPQTYDKVIDDILRRYRKLRE